MFTNRTHHYRLLRHVLAVSVVLVAGLFSVFSSVQAQANPQINYQAKLTDPSGIAVVDGSYNVRFFLYADASTTTVLWTETLTGIDAVPVVNGLFSVMLGSTTPLSSVDFNQSLYLGVEIGATGTPAWDGEMTPRKILGTVPAAFVAQTAGQADNAALLGGVASTSFLRSDIADSMDAFLTLTGGASTSDLVVSGTATTTNLVVGTDFISDLTGAGLTITGNALTVATGSLGLGDGTLAGLTDTIIATPTTGQLLGYSSGQWINFATSSLAIALGDTTGTLGATRGGTGLTTFGGSNTILYTSAADTLAWDTGFTFNGTTFSAPTTTLSGRLTMSGSVANIALGSNWLSGDGDDEGIFVDGSGNVGVGTSTPEARLSIIGLDAPGTAGANASTTFYVKGGTGAPLDGFQSQGGRGADIFMFAGDGGDATGFQPAGGEGGDVFIAGGSAGSPSSSLDGHVILAHDGTSGVGLVGIGTDAPVQTLTVGGTLGVTGSVRFNSFTNGLLSVDGSGNLSTAATSSLNLASSSLAASNWTDRYVLQASSTASGGFAWVATSTLGITFSETNALETIATGIANNELFIGTGANTGNYVTLSGDATLANTGALTLASSITSITSLANLTTTGALNAGSITSGFGNIDIGASNLDADGTITFGGLTNGLLLANGSGLLSSVATNSLNIALSDTTGTLAATRGGTGLSTITQNQLLIGGAGDTWTQIATSSLGLSAAFSNSTQLAALLSDETGTGFSVFSDSPVFTTQITAPLLTNAGTLALSATGANVITASTNGSERLRIDSAGNVGVGTTAPVGRLSVSSASLAQTWQEIGTELNIAGFLFPALTTLSPNRVAFIDATNADLRVYEFNGSSWSQIGTELPISSVGFPALTTLSPNRVAFIDATNADLRVYEFNGSTWSQIGTELNIAGFFFSILTTLSPNRVAFIDATNADLRVYQFSSPTFFVGNNQDSPFLSVSDAGYVTAEAMLVNAGLTVNSVATGTNAINGTSSPALVVNGSSIFGGNIFSRGKLSIGTTSASSLLTIAGGGFSEAGTFGIDQYLTTANSVADAIQFGNLTFINASNTATTTLVGSMFRVQDNTTLGNTIRALEVQADRGSNTQGENTALSGFARTFGVRGTTRGDAGGEFEPAGGFFATEGTTQGNAIRGYSNTITTSALLSLFQDTSSFAGTGLLMNFGNAGGSFSSSTASNFIRLQNAGTTLFSVNASGTVTIGEVGGTTNLASLQIGFGGICVDDDGACTATTSGRITATEYTTANSDLAEQYFSSEALEPGEIVYLKGGLSVGRATGEVKDRVIGVVSTKPGLTLGANDVPTTPGETGYPIALTGRVPIRLSNENGSVKKGDQLMLSSIPGVAMKASSTGVVVGIALEDFDETRAYSDTYISQYGENIIVPEYVPVTEMTDSRINDGCYFGGGGATDESPCVPLPAATSSDMIIAAANIAALEEAKERALRALARERSERAETATGEMVSVGQITMFVDLRYRYLDETTEVKLARLMNSTSTLVGLNGEVEEVNVSLMDRVIDLTSRFFDGVLTLVGIKAEKVETNELCIGDTCVNETQLIELLNTQAAPQGSGVPATATPASINESESDQTSQPEPELILVPEPALEPPATTTEPNTASTTPPALEPTPDTGSSTPQTEPVAPEELTEEVSVEGEILPESEPAAKPQSELSSVPEFEIEEVPEPSPNKSSE